MIGRGYLNEDYTLTVVFQVDGDRVVPTPGTTHYTVRDNSGTPIAGLTRKKFPVSSSQALITVAAENNAVQGFYHVEVVFQHLGSYHARRYSYQIAPFLPLAATTDSVRSLLGLTEQELPDGDISMEVGYYALLEDGFDLSTILTASDNTAYHANRAVALRTALDLSFSLPLRALKSETSEVGGMDRFSLGSKDWEGIRRDLARRLSHAVLAATGGTATAPVFLVTTAPVDPVTGA